MTDESMKSRLPVLISRINWILVAVDLLAMAIYIFAGTNRSGSHGPGMSGLGNALIAIYAVVLTGTIVAYAVVFGILHHRGWIRTTTVLFGLFVLLNLYAFAVAVVISLSR